METDHVGLFSETSSGHVESILSDESLLAAGDSAGSRVLTESSDVRVLLFLQEVVCHL